MQFYFYMYISSYKIFFNCIILYDIKIKFGVLTGIRTYTNSTAQKAVALSSYANGAVFIYRAEMILEKMLSSLTAQHQLSL